MLHTSLRSTLALLLLGAALVLPCIASGYASSCTYPPTGGAGGPAPAVGAVGPNWAAAIGGGTSPYCAGAPVAFDAMAAGACGGLAGVAVAGAWCDAVVLAAPPPGALPPPLFCTVYPSATAGSGMFVSVTGVVAGWDVAGPPPPGTPGAPPPGFIPGPGTPAGLPVGAPDGNMDGWDQYVAGPLSGGIAATAAPGGPITAGPIYPPVFGPAGTAQLIVYPVATYTPPAPLGAVLPTPTIPVGCI